MNPGPRIGGAIEWLLEGDPAIRWQVMRDLLGTAERAVDRERRRVARDGWGARLLSRQAPGGSTTSTSPAPGVLPGGGGGGGAVGSISSSTSSSE